MDSMVMGPEDGRRRRRSHSAQFKAESVAACQQTGVSIAAVALSRSLNANLLRSWVVAAERREASGERAAVESGAAVEPAAFLPVPLSCAANTGAPIRIEIRRGSTQVTVRWPISVASECGQWLRELLR